MIPLTSSLYSILYTTCCWFMFLPYHVGMLGNYCSLGEDICTIRLLLSQNTADSCVVLYPGEKAVSTPITLMFRAFSRPAARLAVFGRCVQIARTPEACLTTQKRVPLDNNDKIIVWQNPLSGGRGRYRQLVTKSCHISGTGPLGEKCAGFLSGKREDIIIICICCL